MTQNYIIQGFTQYLIIDKILYKKAKICIHENYKFQYRNMREIKRCVKNGNEGYYLEKNHIIKFYPLKKLKHKLKLVINN